MTLEWIRRQIPEFDGELRTYLFTTGDITNIEEDGAAPAESPDAPARTGGDLGIGSLKKGR